MLAPLHHIARVSLVAIGLALAGIAGCSTIHVACDAIPANQVPPDLAGPSRSIKAPIDFSLLRQKPPEEHVLGPGDIVGVYVQNVIPVSSEEPPVTFQPNQATGREHFAPTGLAAFPAVGVPFRVAKNSTLRLPFVTQVPVGGMTVEQAEAAIREAYKQAQVIHAGKEQVIVTLIKPRIHRVLVIREDTLPNGIGLIDKEQTQLAHRGSGDVIDLPADENDVLHALLATGGLPGLDARNDVWILRGEPNNVGGRGGKPDAEALDGAPKQVVDAINSGRPYVRIPLKVVPGEPLPFDNKDILLYDGDIVFVESRATEFFFTGGLLPGAQIPLPRDYDLDVTQAIAVANGSLGGPVGGAASLSTNFRQASVGNIITASRVIVVRTLPTGEKVRIRVDLSRAIRNPSDSLIIQPGDFVLLQYKPVEFAGNFALNLFNLNMTFLTGVTSNISSVAGTPSK